MNGLLRQYPEQVPARPRSAPRALTRPTGPAESYLQLQRAVGNLAGQGLLRAGAGGTVQASRADAADADPWEREADRAAEAAYGGGAGGAVLTPVDRAPPSAPRPTPGVRTALASLEAGGRELPEPVRSELGTRMGHDFAGVRVHDDARAGSLALALNARAFTLGRNVVFAPGQYAPHTPAGGRVLAHELAHTVQQEGAGASAGAVQRLGYGEVKEAAYRAMIDGVRGAQGAAVSAARSLARESLPPHLHGAADVLLDVCEGVADVLVSLCYAVLGVLVGAGEAVFGILEGLVRLATAAIRYVVAWTRWLFGRPDDLERLTGDLQALVAGFVPGLQRLASDWMRRFEHAPPERQTLMIGELTGEVLVFIATLGAAGSRAGQLPKLSLAVPAGVMAGPGGALAVRTVAVGVSVGEPALAAVGTGLAMAMTGSGGGGGQGPDDDVEKFLREQEERIGSAEEIEVAGRDKGATRTAGQAHGQGGVSVEELGFAARQERLFSFNVRSRQLGYRGVSRAAPGTDEVIVAVGKDGRWRIAGGADVPAGLRPTLLQKLRAMVKNIDPGIDLAE